MAARHQLSRNWREHARAGKQLLQSRRENAQAGAKHLCSGDMAEILMRKLMRQNSAQLIVVGPPQQAQSHIKFAVAGIGCVDPVFVYKAHSCLINATRLIHATKKRHHDAP